MNLLDQLLQHIVDSRHLDGLRYRFVCVCGATWERRTTSPGAEILIHWAEQGIEYERPATDCCIACQRATAMPDLTRTATGMVCLDCLYGDAAPDTAATHGAPVFDASEPAAVLHSTRHETGPESGAQDGA